MASNAERWARALFTRSTQINAQAAKIAANRSRYEFVSKTTGVPWDVIGVIHFRESSNDFRGVLHNGQKIIGTGKKTTLVPKGRGPFSTWEEAAIDALVNCHPHLARNKDWSISTTLDKLEAYNGLGYRNKGLPSPYLWAGTDQYVKGKYVADGKFDPNHVDKQLGVAPILMKLRDQVAKPTSAPKPDHPAPKPAPTPSQPLPEPAKGKSGFGWLIAAIIILAAVAAAIFWRF
jgi:lysozyme family protein